MYIMIIFVFCTILCHGSIACFSDFCVSHQSTHHTINLKNFTSWRTNIGMVLLYLMTYAAESLMQYAHSTV